MNIIIPNGVYDMGGNSVIIEQFGNYLKISFKGNLVYGQTEAVKKVISEKLEKKDGYIIDTTNVTDIDSTGFGVLVNTAKKLKSKKIAIVVNDELIRELFEIAKFSMLFPIVETIDEAKTILSEDIESQLTIDEY